jgi:hypothetical protein
VRHPYWEQPAPAALRDRPFLAKNVELTPPKWKSAPPVIQDGKVVFTAPDADSIHCVRLTDGVRVWQNKKTENDLFLAGVFGGKVVIVGQKSVRALRLSDGSPLWNVDLAGQPSGQGAFERNIYYLPVKTQKKTAAILAIDVDRGTLSTAGQSSKEQDLGPGNLVFYPGMILAQSPRELSVFIEENAGKTAFERRAQLIRLAHEGASRSEILTGWKELARGKHAFVEEAKQMAGHYESLVAEDRMWNGVVDYAGLPAKDKAFYWMHLLRDCDMKQLSEPGQCHVLGEFRGLGSETPAGKPNPAIELVKLGKDALPEIIAHMDDARPTRCLAIWRLASPESHYLLRYGDCCQQIFEAITSRTIYERKHPAATRFSTARGYSARSGRGFAFF